MYLHNSTMYYFTDCAPSQEHNLLFYWLCTSTPAQYVISLIMHLHKRTMRHLTDCAPSQQHNMFTWHHNNACISIMWWAKNISIDVAKRKETRYCCRMIVLFHNSTLCAVSHHCFVSKRRVSWCWTRSCCRLVVLLHNSTLCVAFPPLCREQKTRHLKSQKEKRLDPVVNWLYSFTTAYYIVPWLFREPKTCQLKSQEQKTLDTAVNWLCFFTTPHYIISPPSH